MLGLLQARALGLGPLQDRDVGVGAFPEREKVFIRRERLNARSGGIGALRRPRRQRLGTSHSQVCQGTDRLILNDAGMIDYLLELGGRGVALLRCQVSAAA